MAKMLRVCLLVVLLSFADARSWTDTKLKLKPLDCPPLSNIPRGTVYVTGTEPGATATYSCDSTHKLHGAKTRTCEFGSWTGDEPICRVHYSCAMDNTFENDHGGYFIGMQ
ncbi:hypothetical protein ACHHYP_07395 [Achlya hypogyna]|uniref:Secreted protein n=1 Tax=Achlya hypogyna TaxID=1202772 RepID=A0A0A7CNW3_ACHHY|nr:secreted protein [Achlya hypogyna]OQR99081.1 hypothetical protein ACHHYP_07395 [Achlya hypogyna]